MNPVLVNLVRGGTVESSHAGALAVVDSDGAVLVQIGDIDRHVFPRSAVKLLQALPLVASGAADRLGLTDAELALACASHNGEPLHTQTAASMLAKAGLDVQALECGVHWPHFDAAARALAGEGSTPTALHNNCSGKHAGFVCLGCAMSGGAASGGPDVAGFLRGYVQPEHAVMREVGAALQAATGFDLATTTMGIDGCSIPTWAIPLRRLALAFARVATGTGLSGDHARAARRLREAIAREPFMVAGTGRFDTRVMQRLGERACVKVGAEGVYCAALPERGLGVALKMDDGNNARAAEVAMAALLEALLALPDDDAAFMRSLSEPRLRNWNGIEVGGLAPAAVLRDLRPEPRGEAAHAAPEGRPGGVERGLAQHQGALLGGLGEGEVFVCRHGAKVEGHGALLKVPMAATLGSTVRRGNGSARKCVLRAAQHRPPSATTAARLPSPAWTASPSTTSSSLPVWPRSARSRRWRASATCR